jgi:hypothetical protein
MRSAQKESITNLATSDYDVRMDFADQMVSRRQALGFTPAQIAESARVTEMSLGFVEQGVAFEDSQYVACAILGAIERLEILKAGKAHLRVV